MNTSLNTSSAFTGSKSWLTSALMFGLPMGLLFSWQTGHYSIGIPMGLAAGCVFAMFLTGFAGKQSLKFAAQHPDFAGEMPLHEGPANHFQRAESVGGYLWLTSGRLHFRSHKLNLQNHEWRVPLADIVSVEATKTLGFIPNGLRVRVSSGEEHRFIVNHNAQWAECIQRARKEQAV